VGIVFVQGFRVSGRSLDARARLALSDPPADVRASAGGGRALRELVRMFGQESAEVA
jgi:hypothetical protein